MPCFRIGATIWLLALGTVLAPSRSAFTWAILDDTKAGWSAFAKAPAGQAR